MSIERVRAYFRTQGIDSRIRELGESSATVALAAKALALIVGETPILVVTAGDAKIDNAKYRALFHAKAKMLTPEETSELIGHAPGGVCPFAVNDGVKICLDVSLKRFDEVFPACGSGNSAIGLTIPELEKYSGYPEWVDVCKLSEQ